MKNINIFKLIAIMIVIGGSFSSVQAQVVKSFNYQGVVLDDDGAPIANESVSVTVTIPPSSVSSTSTALTSSLGAFSVQIEVPMDEKFDESVNYVVNTSVTTSKGTVSSAAPLSVVPMAIFAEKAAGIAGVDVLDESPTNEIQTLSIEGNALTISGAGGNTVNIPTGGGMGDGDNDPNNEIQTWDEVDGKPAGFADDVDDVNDADSDPMNEIQTWSQIPGVPPAFVDGIDNVDDADADPENEIQTISIDGTTITLSGGGGSVIVPSGGTDADADPTNEIQTLDAGNTGTSIELYLTDPSGGSQTVTVADNVDDADADPENEKQTLGSEEAGNSGLEIYLNNNDGSTESTVFVPYEDSENELQTLYTPGDNGMPIIGISNGNEIDLTEYLPDNSPTNEIQDLSLNGSMLSISNGSSVDLGGLGSDPLWQFNTDESIFYTQGNVGIGSFSPGSQLTVSGMSDLDGITIGNNDGVNEIRSPFGFGLNINNQWVSTWGAQFSNLEVDGATNLLGTAFVMETLDVGGDVTSGDDFIAESEFQVRPGSTNIVRIGELSTGAGYFNSYSSSGTSLASISTTTNGAGWIGIRDGSGTTQATLSVNSNGQGVVSADIKNFVTDHPTRPGMSIVYASLEGPEAGAYERGTGVLADGEAQILFSDHFSQIAIPSSMTVILTPLSADSEGMAVIEKTGNGFKVKELRNGSGNYSFDWEVKCKRQGFEGYQVVRPTSEFEGEEPSSDDK